MTKLQKILASGAAALVAVGLSVSPVVFGTRARWVVATSRAQIGVMAQMQRLINAHYGLPTTSYLPNGAPAGSAFSTTNVTGPTWNANVPNEAAMPLDGDGGLNCYAYVQSIVSGCLVGVEAGVLDGGPVPSYCTVASTLTFLPDPLPSTWIITDGGYPWWCEAGVCGSPTLPDDFAPDAGEDAGSDSGTIQDSGPVLDSAVADAHAVVVTP